MIRHTCSIVFFAIFLVGCVRHEASLLRDTLDSAPAVAGEIVWISGFLCVGPLTVRLSSSTNCEESEQQQLGSILVELVLNQRAFTEARGIPIGAAAIVKGRIRRPPPEAIRFDTGLQLGYSIEVIELTPVGESREQ